MKSLTCRLILLVILALTLPGLTGCRTVGPSTVKRDRLHYSAAVSESWKEQLLLNIVKTRYGDAPAFLEVASLVSGYSLETGVSFNGQFSPESLRGDTFLGGELSGKFTDRPTISYMPMTGERFTRSLLAPVPLEALMFVIEGGAPADFLLGLTVQSFEGHRNQGISGGRFEPGDASFAKVLQLLQTLKQAGIVELENIRQGERVESWLQFRSPDLAKVGTVESLAELKALLGVPASLDRVRVVFGTASSEPDVIGIRTRSLMQILGALGAGVQIPADHLASGAAVAVGPSRAPGGFVVRCAKKQPEAAFVAVPYEGLWFWIDRHDLPSKTTLSTVTVLFSFLDTSDKSSSPVLTIPAN
jgi:hypothetical protein